MPESLHVADLGIFPAILFAIFQQWDKEVFQWLDDPVAAWSETNDLLAAKLGAVRLLNNEGVGGSYVCNIGHKIREAQEQDDSVPILKAWEFRRLMHVCDTSCVTSVHLCCMLRA